jgi:hypothetical protein
VFMVNPPWVLFNLDPLLRPVYGDAKIPGKQICDFRCPR